ncbi:MAG: hypothetical protein CME70_23710 [Halobacteriovorax sp.]|nr:hypothetical protein [Halobacteriovorax sp.]|tara:strand:- start:95001 stop:96434 length:1434 start_codon:yes stop_codon:yes gene_type:complete
MRNAWMKLLLIIGIFSLSFRLFAVDVLTLSDVRKEVLSDNIDIKIQYEKYYQAQKSVQVALGEFLPRLNVEMLRISGTLSVAQAILPTPSDWFSYQASQELEVAEAFATETLRLNILEGMTKNFINIKFQEELVASAEEQTKLLEEILETMIAREALGAATPTQVYIARKTLQSHKQQLFALRSIISAEKFALNMALSRIPTQEYVLGELPEVSTEMVPETIAEGTELAINNSTELAQNFFLKEGAQYMEASARWSFLSFQGIGFDYPALVAIEKSKVRVIELQGQRTELKIRNQVHATYKDLELIDERIEIQEQIIAETEKDVAEKEVLYKGGQITFEAYVDARKTLMAEERALISFEMEKEIKKVTLKRQLGFDASLNTLGADYTSLVLNLDVTLSSVAKHKKVTATLKGSKAAMADIVSVKYSVTNMIKDERVIDMTSNYAKKFKLKKKGNYVVTAEILMLNGEVLTREVQISR